jgi:hypothetical protein
MTPVPQHRVAPPSRGRRRLTLVTVALMAFAGLTGAYALESSDAHDAAEGVAVSAGSSPSIGARPPADAGATGEPEEATTTSARGELGSGAAATIAFAGDMNFEGSNGSRLDADPATAVGPFADIIRRADLAVGNLEIAIAVGGTGRISDSRPAPLSGAAADELSYWEDLRGCSGSAP